MAHAFSMQREVSVSRPRTPRSAGRRALSLVEVLVSVVVVSSMLVAALYTVGASRSSDSRLSGGTEAILLAEALMDEILQLPYEDPESAGVMGPEAGETGTDRTGFDDIDDYDNWVSEPPVERDGTAIPWAAPYERLVRIHWLDPNDLKGTSNSTPTAMKRIRVKVSREGQAKVVLFAVRSESRPDGIQVEEAPE